MRKHQADAMFFKGSKNRICKIGFRPKLDVVPMVFRNLGEEYI